MEINEFADMLQSQRLDELEATALLRCVISSMDAPVLAFDPEHRLRLINPAARAYFPSHCRRGPWAAALRMCDSPACSISPIGESWFLPARAIPSIGW